MNQFEKNVIIKKNQNVSRYYISITFSSQKFNKRLMAGNITGETKREGQNQKMHSLQEPKKRERVSPSCGRKLSHTSPL